MCVRSIRAHYVSSGESEVCHGIRRTQHCKSYKMGTVPVNTRGNLPMCDYAQDQTEWNHCQILSNKHAVSRDAAFLASFGSAPIWDQKSKSRTGEFSRVCSESEQSPTDFFHEELSSLANTVAMEECSEHLPSLSSSLNNVHLQLKNSGLHNWEGRLRSNSPSLPSPPYRKRQEVCKYEVPRLDGGNTQAETGHISLIQSRTPADRQIYSEDASHYDASFSATVPLRSNSWSSQRDREHRRRYGGASISPSSSISRSLQPRASPSPPPLRADHAADACCSVRGVGDAVTMQPTDNQRQEGPREGQRPHNSGGAPPSPAEESP